MPTPYQSQAVVKFNLSSNSDLNSLLNTGHYKFSGKGDLTYSFPFTANPDAYFVTGYGSEPHATYRFGLNGTEISAAKLAMQMWINVADIHFRGVDDSSQSAGTFRFAFSSALPANEWGHSWTPYPNDPKSADIWINDDQRSDTAVWDQGSQNFLNLMHEIGHGLGFKHPGNYDTGGNISPPYINFRMDNWNYTIMSYNDPSYSGWVGNYSLPETPGIMDIQAIQYLYGANKSFHAGDDVYTFNEPQFNRTIWDAGGADTLDFSSGWPYYLGVSVSLDPGGGASLPISGSATGSGFDLVYSYSHLGIALNCYIENAIGTDGYDSLSGNKLKNILIGAGGMDTLDGGKGADTLIGGTGNDTYYIDNSGDHVIENTDEGTDTIVSTFSYSLADTDGLGSAFGGNVENLTLSSTGASYRSAINATGNDLANILTGNGGANILAGGGGNDTLFGGEGNDELKGGDGADSMEGGYGNDTYYVNDANDITIETSSETAPINTNPGNDTVISSAVSYSLSANVERLTLATGTTNLDAIGNDGANVLTGNTGANHLYGGLGNDALKGGGGDDTLSGGLGKDALTGGTGRDVFLFDTPLDASANVDTIADFKAAEDTIYLDHDVFATLGLGQLTVSMLVRGNSMAGRDADDRIIYNTTTGNLYYDADGNGGGVAVKFAVLTGHPSLAHADFVVV